MQSNNMNQKMAVTLAVVVAALVGSTSAFTVVQRTTTSTNVLGRQQQLVPRSSTLLSNDSETVSDATGDDEQVAVTAETSPVVELGAEEEEKKPEYVVYIGNLAFTVTPNDVRELISEKIGDDSGIAIESISMPTNNENINEETGEPLSKGFCFVHVGSPEQVTTVVDALNGYELEGRNIRANTLKSKEEIASERAAKKKRNNSVPAGKKKLYVGNLSFDATRDDVREAFEKYGACDDVYLPMRDGVPRGFGFVTMAEEDADKAMADLDGTEFFTRKLIVNEPLKEGEAPVRRPRVDRSKQFKMYIGNLSFYTTKETLEEIFSEFGDVYDCYLPLDPETERPRGFGFVTMDKEAGEEAIQELDGMELDDRVIRVNEAQGKRRAPAEMKEKDETFDSGDEF
mmetsp:Transcript_46686/g.113767  ORF Transcript_46686/g.113767 Transcript_46686/m.113767 type:complete len:400 (-) Transcript_46686:329-1528(-)